MKSLKIPTENCTRKRKDHKYQLQQQDACSASAMNNMTVTSGKTIWQTQSYKAKDIQYCIMYVQTEPAQKQIWWTQNNFFDSSGPYLEQYISILKGLLIEENI